MRLTDALRAVAAARDLPAGRHLVLACGFNALHLPTYLRAHYLERSPGSAVEVDVGIYGDLEGTLRRAALSSAHVVVVLLEWADLDPRLGLRSVGPWSGRNGAQLLADAGERLDRLASRIDDVARHRPVVLCGPTLPLPWVGATVGAQHSAFELEIQASMATFLCRVGGNTGVRVVHRARIDALSPVSDRHDARSELSTGFPFRLPHASALALLVLELAFPPPPKKGLITDLDGTAWAGLVGEIGPQHVGWTQADGAQIHGLYQLVLCQLADAGVLLAVASKNDPEIVASALARPELLLDRSTVYPVCASWGPKSRAVASILEQWNIAQDDVVFVDDTMLELDEVRRAFPRMECLRFTPGDPGEVVRLLERLRDLFGRPTVTAEDLSRTASLQAAVAFESNRAVHEDPLDFIKQLEGTVTIRRDHPDDAPRALQLTNKTNQFNLNGDRIAETDLQALLAADEGFVLVVSYADRYGSLGRIGVVAGRLGVDTLEVLHWVLSCRAFSRFIEHHMLQRVLALAERRTVRLAYRETPRNSPLREFLGTLGLQFEGTEPVVLPSATADALAKLAPHATDGGRDA